MAAVPPNELWNLWKQDQITPEIAVGQLIQNQVDQQSALAALRQTIAHLQTQIDKLLTQRESPPAKGKK